MPQVKITVFDDGNQSLKQNENIWTITNTMFHGSKVELINAIDKNIKIRSISTWKTERIEDGGAD
jgi:hypothetical protein